MRKNMKVGMIFVVGCVMISMIGCASTVDSLSNNTSSGAVRGVKLGAGVDAVTGNPAPNVSLVWGSVARQGKSDRTVITMNGEGTNIVSEDYNVSLQYGTPTSNTKNPRQFLSDELRVTEENDKPISVRQESNWGFGIVGGDLFSMGGETEIRIGGNHEGTTEQ